MNNVFDNRSVILPLLTKQLSNFFEISDQESLILAQHYSSVLDRLEVCFNSIRNKYYSQNGQAVFCPYHSGQYSIFLYYFSNTMGKIGESELAGKIYYLNKIMNGLDLYFEIELPPVFFVEHPVGAVMGRAVYGDYFAFQQNCTVGGNKGIYPQIGEKVWMFANSSIIGNSHIGNNVFVGAGCMIKDENIPNNSVVFGQSPNLIIKQRSEEYFSEKSAFLKTKF